MTPLFGHIHDMLQWWQSVACCSSYNLESNHWGMFPTLDRDSQCLEFFSSDSRYDIPNKQTKQKLQGSTKTINLDNSAKYLSLLHTLQLLWHYLYLYISVSSGLEFQLLQKFTLKFSINCKSWTLRIILQTWGSCTINDQW